MRYAASWVVALCGATTKGSSPPSRATATGATDVGIVRGLGPGDANRESVWRNEDRRLPLGGKASEESKGRTGSEREGKESLSFEWRDLISPTDRVRVRWWVGADKNMEGSADD